MLLTAKVWAPSSWIAEAKPGFGRAGGSGLGIGFALSGSHDPAGARSRRIQAESPRVLSPHCTSPASVPALHSLVVVFAINNPLPDLCDLKKGLLCRPATLCHFLAGHLKSLYRIKEFSVPPEVCSGPLSAGSWLRAARGWWFRRTRAQMPSSWPLLILISSLNSCPAPKIAQPLPLTFAS